MNMYNYFRADEILPDNVYIDDFYMDELWWFTPVEGYFVSNYGRVWNAKRQNFIKVKKMDNCGHLGVCLSNNGKCHYFYIHRLMALAFLPNPYNDPIVRHLDDDPTNNDLDNLEWGTRLDNWLDSVRNGTAQPPKDEWREIGLRKTRKPITAKNLETGESIFFEKGKYEAARVLGIQYANIWKVLNGQRSSTCGYSFCYGDRR